MDFKKDKKRSKNPRDKANIFSKLTFFYMVKIIKETAQKKFGQDNIYQPLRDFKSEALGIRFQKLYAQKRKIFQNGIQNKVGIGGILLILAKMFWKKFVSYYIVMLIYSIALTIYQPLIFGKIVAHFRDPNPNIYYLGLALIAINLFNFLIVQHFNQACREITLQIAITLSSAIYRKTLRLKSDNEEKLNSKMGNIVTLITKDVFSFEIIIVFLADLLLAVITISIQMVVIYDKVGWIGLLTVAISVTVIIFGIFLAILSQNQRSKECFYAAQRIDVLKEAFSSIQIVKMSVLESFFIKKCNEYRKKEIFHILNVSFLRMANMLLGRLGSAIAFTVTVLIYHSIKGDFSAEKLFFLSSSLEVIRSFFNYILPVGISRSGECIASLNRLREYFLINDINYLDKSLATNIIYNKPSIKTNNLSLEFNGKSIIKGLSLEVLENCLLIVSGPVGSGKTALLKAIIGEIETSPNDLSVKGNLSYASQEPWLFPGMIRQNILFGQEFDKHRYEEVVQRCALSYDFAKFQNSDETLVIDDGVNLSKGQKMRINLARAIYQNKQIYLLDSVLNNLDVQTSHFIFEKVIKEFLKDKICIFVSDNPKHYKMADKVLVFTNNSVPKIICKNLIAHEFPSLDNEIENRIEPNEENIEEDCNELSSLLNPRNSNLKTTKNIQYIYKEDDKRGNIRFSTYKFYAKFCGGIWIVLYLLLTFILAQVCIIVSEKYMSIWINSEEKLYQITKNITFDKDLPNYQSVVSEKSKSFQIYIIGFVTNVVVYITTSFSTLYVCTRAAKKIHKSMVKSVVYSHMDFFSKTLLGTILNRFSKDINNIDDILPTLMYNSIITIFDSIGLFVMVALAQWIFLVPILIIVFLALIILKWILLPVITKAKRLEAALHSPMVGYVSCTLNGLSTIRVLGANLEKLVQEFDYHQDLFAAAIYISYCVERVLKVFLQIACIILLAIVVFYFILFDNSKSGDVGLGIGKTLVIIRIIDYSLSQYMQIEAQLTSIERIRDYFELQEENRSGLNLSKNWKCNGNIIVQNLNLTYNSTNQWVLKNINLTIEPGEKIAIVGRTGSGKSSLISCLFRLYDYSGYIIINGVDIKGLELNYLRSQLGVISQDSLILSSSLRENIDPFKEHSDSDILLLISNISEYFKEGYKQNKQIFHEILKSNINLDMQINREKLSAGERQFISLLRVLLSRRQILILDEIAEDLDEEANKAMQNVIEKYFKNCIVFYILHKLENIKRMDKICVIQDGKIVEFDTPRNLCKNQSSKFWKMVKYS